MLEPKDVQIATIQNEIQGDKGMFLKWKKNYRAVEHFKQPNIHIIGVSKEDEKRVGQKNWSRK